MLARFRHSANPLFRITIALTLLVMCGCGLQQPQLKAGRIRQPDSAAIATLVRSALMEHPATSALPIRVNTEHGIVLLTGVVDTAGERRSAEQVTWTVKGVFAVENHVVVRDMESLTSFQNQGNFQADPFR